jgi:hypothetical protein
MVIVLKPSLCKCCNVIFAYTFDASLPWLILQWGLIAFVGDQSSKVDQGVYHHGHWLVSCGLSIWFYCITESCLSFKMLLMQLFCFWNILVLSGFNSLFMHGLGSFVCCFFYWPCSQVPCSTVPNDVGRYMWYMCVYYSTINRQLFPLNQKSTLRWIWLFSLEGLN